MAEKEKEWVLIIEHANVSMKLALKAGVVDTLEKEVIKASVRQIIEKAKTELKAKEAPIDLITKFENSMKLRFVEWYKYVTLELMRQGFKNRNPLLLKSYEAITGEKLKNSKGINVNMEGYEVGSIPDVRKYMTTGRTAGAQSFMPDYVNTVKKVMQTIAEKNLVMKDRLGRKLSLRNLAEMTARFQNIQERLQTLKDEGVEYVVASTHSNASERCQIWQGKVFIIDCDIGAPFKQTVDLKYHPKPLGKIDGINYYSLKDAMLHGFLGYNCRHRLVKYMKGMDLFNQYDANTITKERQLEERQRYLERKIRKAKERASLAITPEERKKYIAESKYYQEVYGKFCHDKGLVRYDWRTRITNVERNIKVDYGEESSVLDKIDSFQEPNANLDVFKSAETIQEAEEYARNELGIPIVNYKGIDVKVANVMNKSFYDLLKYAPEAKNHLNAIGSIQETNKLMIEDFKDYYYKLFNSKKFYKNLPEEELKILAQKYAKKSVFRFKPNTYALANPGGVEGNPKEANQILEKYKGIFVNNAYGKDYEQFESSTMMGENSKFHPVGCGTIKAVFDHECGHILDYVLSLRDIPEIKEIFDSYQKSDIIKMTEDLSKYAWSNSNSNKYAEMIAEAYSEYRNNPKPRKIASKIGAIIEELVRRKGP